MPRCARVSDVPSRALRGRRRGRRQRRAAARGRGTIQRSPQRHARRGSDMADRAAARNAAAARAHGRFLALTDDDCAPVSHVARHAPATRSRVPARCARGRPGGRVENALVENAMASASQLLISYLYEYFTQDTLAAALFHHQQRGVRRRRRSKTIGGFDVQSLADTAEDRDLCDRWWRSGRPLVYDADALVHHHNPFTLGSFARCHFKYGREPSTFTVRANRRGGVATSPRAACLLHRHARVPASARASLARADLRRA